ncbi:hypothetical protein SPRG_16003 [Saprolegnia parasitica CBS 223.65]|uniref:HAT C-terminal dimerisation domain-containing protein n=1 Tax=Saprolegnia parasitica (strain CBS 223.65) TaxID=695850 RepID=A0A067BVN6_SAPPC|nr:hypothetical protein SPRG_16003 [Saprolegnia parasitica CBS 223.65]KDO18657.1 hypothetical protein SPRG_16003 [Saprolegnia parasitica CBS 223.65]|eukprot:XP_012210643.1 hypothetical protein SPRG_16003 [Saprolegnia parasitica CBS 223.65]
MAPAKAAPFLRKWLDDFSWLVYDESKTVAGATLSNTLYDEGFHYGLAFMNDVLCMLNQLSRSLQGEDLLITCVPDYVCTTTRQLAATFLADRAVGTIATPSLNKWKTRMAGEFDDYCASETVCLAHCEGVEYVRRLVKAIGDRFPIETSKTFKAFSCLFIEHMRCAQDLVAYGVDEVEFLRDIYLPDVQDSDVAQQYGAFKQYVMCAAPQSAAMDFLTFVLTDSHVAKMYPSIVQLITIAATLAPGSVDCERAFSLENLVKTDNRTSLSTSHLQDLMVCARDGPESSKLDVPAMMGKWIAAKEEANAKRRQV